MKNTDYYFASILHHTSIPAKGKRYGEEVKIKFDLRLLYILVDSFLLIVSIFNIHLLPYRATLPFSLRESEGNIIVDGISDKTKMTGISIGDTIITIQDSVITIPEQCEFISDLGSIGKAFSITAKRNGTVHLGSFSLISYYPTTLYSIVVTFIGSTFFVVGFFVFWNRPQDPVAHIFHWMMVLVGTAMMTTWGSLSLGDQLSLMFRSTFFISYVFGVASFYIFTAMYCSASNKYNFIRILAVYITSAIICSELIRRHFSAIIHRSLMMYERFQHTFDLFHAMLFITFIGGLLNVIRAYRRAHSTEEKHRLEWILYGFSVGATPFLLLYILPQLIVNTYIVREEYTTIFFIIIPFSFGVSFIRYRLFDIRLLIKRTIVYFIFSGIISLSFFIIIALITTGISRQNVSTEYFLIITLTILTTMLLNPLREKIQSFIDGLLFKTHAQYSTITMEVSRSMRNALTPNQIFKTVFETTYSTLPIEQSTIYKVDGNTFIPTFPEGIDQRAFDNIDIKRLQSLSKNNVMAVSDIVRSSDPRISFIDKESAQTMGVELFAPFRDSKGILRGAIGIKRTTSKDSFDSDEITLLLAVSELAAEHLERLELVESFFREKEEKNRAKELNSLKSKFVSNVSHELQTPLTSIAMFSELLEKKATTKKEREYIRIISGESERLHRMVKNILDASRIESGIREYAFESCDLREIVTNVITSMRYMIDKHGFSLTHRPLRTPLPIFADSDAIAQAVINLISNAIKYSSERKHITVVTKLSKGYALCSVADKGDGIPEGSLHNIFDRFHRLPNHQHRVHGIGLGLSLVQHIIKAHNGTISVTSTVKKGSTFTITFPINTTH